MMLCTGLDFAAAHLLADPAGDLDAERLGACLREIEAGRLTGQARQTEKGE